MYVQKILVGGKVARMWTEWAWSGLRGGMTWEMTRHAWATTWGCHHVASSCERREKAQAQVRKYVLDVMTSRYQGPVGLQDTAE